MEYANDNSLAGDLLLGAPAIAKYLGVNTRQIYRFAEDGVVPLFKLGGSIAGRRSTLNEYFASLEKRA